MAKIRLLRTDIGLPSEFSGGNSAFFYFPAVEGYVGIKINHLGIFFDGFLPNGIVLRVKRKLKLK